MTELRQEVGRTPDATKSRARSHPLRSTIVLALGAALIASILTVAHARDEYGQGREWSGRAEDRYGWSDCNDGDRGGYGGYCGRGDDDGRSSRDRFRRGCDRSNMSDDRGLTDRNRGDLWGEDGGPGQHGIDGPGLWRVLQEVNATEEQRSKIRSLFRAARNDIETLRDRLPDLRGATLDLLGKTTIDRGALETLRADRQKTTDEITKRMTQAMVDIAEVLTPEQRTALATRIAAKQKGRLR